MQILSCKKTATWWLQNGIWEGLGLDLEGSSSSLGRLLGTFGRFFALLNWTFCAHGAKMGSRRPFGSIFGGFSKVLGGFWEGFGTVLGNFWNGFESIVEKIWYMRKNWFWTWTRACMQRFGLLCAFSPGKTYISVEPTLHFNDNLFMSGPPRCLA